METLYKNIHQDLIDRCRSGEHKAQCELYKLYYRPMYNISLRILNNEMEAEDAMQDSFLKAFKKIDSYKGEVSFGAWLKKIVINRSLDLLKKRKVKFEEISERKHDEAYEPVEIKEVNVTAIKKAISDLPDGYRVVLNLYLIEGYTHEEISEILGISNTASRTQFLRAKNKLRENLKNKELYAYN